MFCEESSSTIEQKDEILNALWKVERKIGSGSYGCIYQGKNIYTSTKIAIKKFKENNIDEGISSSTLREIVSLRKLKHQNIISVIDVITTRDAIYIVQELMETDLHNYINCFNGPLPLHKIKNILFQILKGVTYIHSKNFFHRDLKPQNILISTSKKDDLIVKITDFGLCRLFAKNTQFTKGTCTPLYRAPEILLGVQEYNNCVDIWSLGCIFAEMCLGEPMFKDCDNEIDILKNILNFYSINTEFDSCDNIVELIYKQKEDKTKLQFQEKFPMLNEDGLDLICKLLTINPNERIKGEEALQHAFFR
jgi:serine/threonine protein kinase